MPPSVSIQEISTPATRVRSDHVKLQKGTPMDFFLATSSCCPWSPAIFSRNDAMRTCASCIHAVSHSRLFLQWCYPSSSWPPKAASHDLYLVTSSTVGISKKHAHPLEPLPPSYWLISSAHR